MISMNIILLRVIIFIIFCLIGLGIGGLVGNRVGNRVGNYKKVDLSKKSIIEECKDDICPEPKDWKGNKK
jgi:hypothetical protein